VVDHRVAFLRAASTGKAVHEAATLTARDGQERSVVISYTSLTDSPDGFQVGVAAVREIAEDTRDAQIADLGHELRSPLTAILGYTGLMLGAAPGSLDAERQAEFLSRIAASGDYMLRLVNNLLTCAAWSPASSSFSRPRSTSTDPPACWVAMARPAPARSR
jgi:cell cycle sensor histidine kinase DivJ